MTNSCQFYACFTSAVHREKGKEGVLLVDHLGLLFKVTLFVIEIQKEFSLLVYLIVQLHCASFCYTKSFYPAVVVVLHSNRNQQNSPPPINISLFRLA